MVLFLLSKRGRKKRINRILILILFVCSVITPLLKSFEYLNGNCNNGRVDDEEKNSPASHHQTTASSASSRLPAPSTFSSDLSSLSKDAFGGCLMIMDDNHFLVEWLAYHWFVLPLRHLTVLIDPKSKTSPRSIFDRWGKFMTIEVVDWTYPGVLAPARRMDKKIDRRKGLDGASPVNQTEIRLYLGMQHKFYEDCMKSYKRRNWTSYVVAIDTDEVRLPISSISLRSHAYSRTYFVLTLLFLWTPLVPCNQSLRACPKGKIRAYVRQRRWLGAAERCARICDDEAETDTKEGERRETTRGDYGD